MRIEDRIRFAGGRGKTNALFPCLRKRERYDRRSPFWSDTTVLQGGSPMKPTLNLVDHLLALGRRYQDLGQGRDALRIFTRLSSFRELPAEAAEEAQVRLAELQLKRRKYGRARRHLAIALRFQPDSARYHFLLAGALRAGDRGNLEKAAEHYRRSLELDPDNVKCLVEYGLVAVRLGQSEEGLARLRQAVEHAPDNAEVVGKLAKGLRLAGRSDEARAALRAALFRNPRAPRFRKLWNEYQYQHLRREQDARRMDRAGPHLYDDEPVLLPFLGITKDTPATTDAGSPTILRHDESAPAVGPHSHWPARRNKQRHVSS
jgi:tetratricopeptide (TPR) repeat protein